MSRFNDKIIAEFRANQGHVETNDFGDTLVILHSIGAKSGKERVNPVMSLDEPDTWVVIASAAGTPKHPGWYFNLHKNPDATIETGTETIDVRATELEGEEYEAAWARFLEHSDSFVKYKEKSQRHFPIFRLARR